MRTGCTTTARCSRQAARPPAAPPRHEECDHTAIARAPPRRQTAAPQRARAPAAAAAAAAAAQRARNGSSRACTRPPWPRAPRAAHPAATPRLCRARRPPPAPPAAAPRHASTECMIHSQTGPHWRRGAAARTRAGAARRRAWRWVCGSRGAMAAQRAPPPRTCTPRPTAGFLHRAPATGFVRGTPSSPSSGSRMAPEEFERPWKNG